MVDHALKAGEGSLVPQSAQVTDPTLPIARLGDMEALHAAHEQRLFRYFLMNLRDADAAHSLTQDTFVKAWRSQASFRGECAPSTWLMRIAINLLRDHVRGGKYKFWRSASSTTVDAQAVAEVLPHKITSAEGSLIARERVATLWRVVDTLSERQRAVFLLRYVEELELPEIAEAVQLPLATVKTHLYRGLQRVRAGMKENA